MCADDEPVILVLMEHVYEPKPTTHLRTWDHYQRIEAHVNVFYHETANGLLKCPENCTAATTIQEKLLKYSTMIVPETTGHGANADDVGDQSVAMSAACVKESKKTGWKKFLW